MELNLQEIPISSLLLLIGQFFILCRMASSVRRIAEILEDIVYSDINLHQEVYSRFEQDHQHKIFKDRP